MFVPWVGYYYSRFGPYDMIDLSLTQYIALYDAIKDELTG